MSDMDAPLLSSTGEVLYEDPPWDPLINQTPEETAAFFNGLARLKELMDDPRLAAGMARLEAVVEGDKAEVYRDGAGEWRWRMVSRNGRIIATSGEGYRRPGYCEKVAQRVTGLVPTRVKP